MSTIENWLLNVFLGKIIARAAVTIAGLAAAGGIHDALSAYGVQVQIDPTLLAGGTTVAAHALFEWVKKSRLATAAAPPPASGGA